MNRIRKILCSILLCAMTLSMLAACGKTSQSASGNSASVTEAAVTEVQTLSEVPAVPEHTSEPTLEPTPEPTPVPLIMTLEQEQRDSVCMLNYITVLTQEINAAKNSRLFLEDAYTNLHNFTDLNAVDQRTHTQILSLMDLMESYRMLDVKRDRLTYLYEQNKAQSISSLMPNPLALLSAVTAFRPSKIAASIAYMAFDSADNYFSSSKSAELEFLQSGWALDDEEATQLHNSRKNLFSYMVNMVHDNSIPSDLVLNEKSVSEFVSWKNNENLTGRILFLESNKETYQAYGGYWLVLAESYYMRGDKDRGDYSNCLAAVQEYLTIDAKIFKKDYELARILPLAISAAEEEYASATFETAAIDYIQLLMKNTDNEDWELRYFAAQTYLDLYRETNNNSYIQAAYDIVLNNVNQLVRTQHALNEVYLAPVQLLEAKKDDTKQAKKDIDSYNKMIKDNRKVELVPIYEPLLLNCELLFALADEMNISQQQKDDIDKILRNGTDNWLFMCAPLEKKFSFKSNSKEIDTSMFGFQSTSNSGTVWLPATLVPEGADVSVEISDGDKHFYITEWKVDNVDRNKSEDVNDFCVSLFGNAGEKLKYSKGAIMTIVIKMPGSEESESITYKLILEDIFIGDIWELM